MSIEAISRKLCKADGNNPDHELVTIALPSGRRRKSPFWHAYRHYAKMQAQGNVRIGTTQNGTEDMTQITNE